MLQIESLDPGDLGSPAPTPQRDLVRVAGIPALQLGRPIENRSRTGLLPSAASRRGGLGREELGNCRVRISEHGTTASRTPNVGNDAAAMSNAIST